MRLGGRPAGFERGPYRNFRKYALRHDVPREEEGSDVFTVEMLDRLSSSLAEFDALADDDPFVAFVEPPSLDERIVNQWALFSVMSDPVAAIDGWLERRPDVTFRRVVIPAALKWEVRDRLDQAGVTERVLSRVSTA